MVFISKNFAIIAVIGVALTIALVGLIVGLTTRKCDETELTPGPTTTSATEPPTTRASTAETSHATEETDKTESTDTEPTGVTSTSTEFPETTQEPPDRDVRLPNSTIPDYYELYLRVDLTNFTTSGSWVKIRFKSEEPTNKVIVHAINNLIVIDKDLTSVVDLDTNENVELQSQEFNDEKEFYIVTLSENLAVSTAYEIYFAFSGIVEDGVYGLYRSSYIAEDGSERWLAATQLQSTYARRVFPCFDEPHLKAKFNVTMVRPKTLKSLSNMDIIASTEVSGDEDWIEDHYEETPVMSSYLLCFVVSDFENLTTTTPRGIEVRAWARPEMVNKTEYALTTTATILEKFEDYFDIPYPLKKTELIALPVFSAGAMENWGLVTYRESLMFYEEGVTTASAQKSICRVIAHELLHMWFGNLVTCAWWSDLWINEGFATYFQYIGCDFAEPEWKMEDIQFASDVLPVAFAYDSTATSHPVVNDAVTPSEIRAIFDRITYQKGGSICQMLADVVGNETWKSSLTAFLKDHQYKSVFTDDLWNTFQTEVDTSGSDPFDNRRVKEVMDTWMLQMGYPLLNVTRDYVGNKVTITQEHYLLDPESEPPSSDFGYLWEIPVRYSTPDTKTSPVIWIHSEREITVDIPADPDDWIVINSGVKGFYRVAYDDKNWENINKQLMSNHTNIDVRNRAQLFEDAFELAKTLRIDQVKAMELLDYLNKEQEYEPWHTALLKLNYIDLMLAKGGNYGNFMAFMNKQTDALYNIVGWEGHSSDDQRLTLLQVDIVDAACTYGNSDCTSKALDLYQNWMDSGENTILADLQASVYCTAIASGDDDEWEHAWGQFEATSDPSDISKLLAAMACSKKIWILQTYLERTLPDGPIKRTDGDRVINYVGHNVIGNYLVWDFIRENWDHLYETYKNSFSAMDRIVRGATDLFSTEFDLSQVEAFRSTIKDKGGNEVYWTAATENIHANILWRNANEETVAEWLEDKLGNEMMGLGDKLTDN